MNRRRALQLIGATAASTALIGCSGGGGTNNATDKNATGEVVFWFPSGDALGNPLILKMVKDYNSGTGKKAKIHVTAKGVPAANNAIKFTTGMTSANSPDAIQTYGFDQIPQWAANGFLRPMDSYLNELGLKQSDFYPHVWQMMHFGGHTWGLLQEWDAELLCYNKDIHKGEPPTTTDELDSLSKEYTKFDNKGRLTQVGLIPWESGGFTDGGWGDWGLIWGAQFYDYDNGKWTITKPENTKFLEWYLKYVDMLGGRDNADKLVSSTPKMYGYSDVFNHGTAAFSMEGEWFPKELAATTKGQKVVNYEISPKLVSAPGINSGKMSTVAGANLFLIPTRSKNPGASARFIRYMVDTPQVVAWSLPIGQGMPTVKSGKDPELLKGLPFMSMWADAAEAGWYQPIPVSPVYSVFSDSMSTAIDNVTRKKQTPTDALTQVSEKVSQALGRFRQSNPKWESE